MSSGHQGTSHQGTGGLSREEFALSQRARELGERLETIHGPLSTL